MDVAQSAGRCEPEDKKKYNRLENVLLTINRKYISLPVEEKKRNSVILGQVLDQFIELMNRKPLFKNLYERKFYGGSYYDQLKVGKPEEYDLDIVLKLPALLEAVVEAADVPGFVHVKIQTYEKLIKNDIEYKKFPKIDTLMDKERCFLSVDKVLGWTEKNITNALQELPKDSIFEVKLNDEDIVQLKAKITKSFPAFTLKLSSNNLEEEIHFDVDLVICFQFTNEKWPSSEANYRPNPFPNERGKFLVVPKKPKNVELENLDYYWRLSFQEQERDLLKSEGFKVMKPAIKLIKKLRDRQNHVKIASYFIKTIFLWEFENKPAEFWNQSLSYVFIEMLKTYSEYLEHHCIPYYWNKNYNLVGHIKESTLINFANCIKCILTEVDKNFEDPFVIASKILLVEECEAMMGEVTLSHKFTKKHQLSNNISSEKNCENGHNCNCECCASKIRKLEEDNKHILALVEVLGQKLGKLEENLENLTDKVGEQMAEKIRIGKLEENVENLSAEVGGEMTEKIRILQ